VAGQRGGDEGRRVADVRPGNGMLLKEMGRHFAGHEGRLGQHVSQKAEIGRQAE